MKRCHAVRSGILAALVAIGCGGERDADAPPSVLAERSVPAPPPCVAVGSGDAERLLGAPVSEPVAQEIAIGGSRDPGTMHTCEWITRSAPRRGTLMMLKQAPNFRAGPDAYAGYAESIESLMGERPRTEAVAGLGAAAIWDLTNRMLLVRGDGWELQVQEPTTTVVDEPLSLATARAFAERYVAAAG